MEQFKEVSDPYAKYRAEPILEEEDEEQAICIKDLATGKLIRVDPSGFDSFDLNAGVRVAKIRAPANDLRKSWGEFWHNIEDSKYKLWSYSEAGNLEGLAELLGSNDIPSLVNAKGLDNWTALHHAALGNQPSVVLYLMNRGCDLLAQTRYKRTAAHIAAVKGHLQVLRMLSLSPSIFSAEDLDLNTPLHLACQVSNEDVISFLLQFNPPVGKNKFGLTPYELCLTSGSRALFSKAGYVFQSNDDEYIRKQIDGVIIGSSRRDHVRKLLDSRRLTVELKEGEANAPAKQGQEKEGRGRMRIRQKMRKFITVQQLPIQKQTLTPDSFNFYKLLGKGSFGEVYLACLKSDPKQKKYAIKVLEKDKVFGKNLLRYASTERNVLTVMRHPFIVQLHFAFQTEDKLFLGLEYCPGGDLGHMLQRKKKLPEDLAKVFVAEIVLAFEQLHRKQFVFRDLKPENVVVDQEGHLRLTDFGLSKKNPSQQLTYSFCGSVAYLAPEVLNRQGHSRTVDWYLVGLLLYELIVGMPPYYHTNKEILFQNIKKGTLKLPKAMSPDAKDLIKGLLCRDPSKRIGAVNDAEDLKRHPFFADIDWQDILARKGKVPLPEMAKVVLDKPMELRFVSEKSQSREVEGWTFIGS